MATPGLSIPELLKIIRYSFRESEFAEVQEILMDRERKMKIEIQDLRRDLDSTKKDAHLLESSRSLAELEKLGIEDKLQRSQSKCKELNDKITRLSEEYKVSCDRAKRAEDCHDKVSKEFSNIISEKNDLILELKLVNSKISELKNTIEENELLVVELRRKQSEADKEVAELRRQNFEATRKLNESRQEKMGPDSKLENMAHRVMRGETGLGNKLNVKVEEGLASLAANGKKVDLPDMIKGWKGSLQNESTNADAENVAIVSDVVSCNRKLDELRREKMGSDSKLENMAQRVMWRETGLGDKFNVKVEEGLASLAANGPDMIKGCKDSLQNESTNADAENVAIVSDVVSCNRKLDELRREKMGSDSKLENMAHRVMWRETGLGNKLNVKVEEGLASLAANGPDMIKGCKDSLQNESTNADAENVAIVSDVVSCNRKLDELRREKMGSDSKLENMAHRVMWRETGLGNKLNVKVEEGLASLAANGPDMIKGCKDSLQNESTNADAKNVAIVSGASNAIRSDDTPLVMKGSHAILTRKPGGSRHSSKMAHIPSAASEVIEISDSDDEAKPGGATYISDKSSGKNTRKRRLVEL
ncbi:hypothetical protein ACS0TY_002159 [Phlomoides rotata]